MKIIAPHKKGALPWIAAVIIIIVIVIVVNIGISTDNSGGGSGGGGSSDICPTRCAWFTQRTCGPNGGRKVGACFPMWSCSYNYSASCN